MNHDGTTGTVDLFPKYLLENTTRIFDINTQYYKNSYLSLRTWLTTTFYNGFTTEVQNAIKVQSFPSNGETLNDKVKCPSLNEIGCRDSSVTPYCIEEGTIYPIFGTQQLRPNNLAIYKYTSGNTMHYWTRSRNTGNSHGVWYVDNSGYCNNLDYGYGRSLAVVACIRF